MITAILPAIRFKDDHGTDFPDWEEKKLGEVCDVNPKSAELPESFIYIDLESVNSGRLHSPREIAKIGAPSRAQRLLKKGDILYQTVRPYQMNNYRFDLDEVHVASTGYAQLRVAEHDAEFVYQSVHLADFLGKVLDRCTGTSYPAINSKDLAKIKFGVPALEEQTKIADFLTAVDGRIGQLIQKKALLVDYKKGVMQQLFTQAIRFKDDHGNDFPNWEEKKLGALGDFVGGGTPDTNNDSYWNGEIPWISSSDVSDSSITEIRKHRFLTQAAIKGSATKLVPRDSILFVSRVGVGKLAVCTQDVCTSQDFTNFTPSKDHIKYLGYYFVFSRNLLNRYAQGTSIQGITSKELKRISVKRPSISEQTKIADFLSAIDLKIESVTTQIAETQTFKRGLLQQMFV